MLRLSRLCRSLSDIARQYNGMKKNQAAEQSTTKRKQGIIAAAVLIVNVVGRKTAPSKFPKLKTASFDNIYALKSGQAISLFAVHNKFTNKTVVPPEFLSPEFHLPEAVEGSSHPNSLIKSSRAKRDFYGLGGAAPHMLDLHDFENDRPYVFHGDLPRNRWRCGCPSEIKYFSSSRDADSVTSEDERFDPTASLKKILSNPTRSSARKIFSHEDDISTDEEDSFVDSGPDEPGIGLTARALRGLRGAPYCNEDVDAEPFTKLPNWSSQQQGIGSSTQQAARRINSRVAIALDGAPNTVVSHAVRNDYNKSEAVAMAPRNLGLTRDTRATVEQVLDQRTLLLIDKLVKWKVITELYGCISTGKEANVYLGILSNDAPLRGNDAELKDNRSDHGVVPERHGGAYFRRRAIKVFKTSILVFKDRSKYVDGEYRFRRGYAGSANPRKMVRQWAEKEFRNYKRLCGSGLVRCPAPIELRGHVIAMSFLGDVSDKASPKLKDVARCRTLSTPFWRRLYVETLVLLRVMFQDCKLVHGDFSEYNLLFHQGHVYLIDVSQSVEQDHPHALDFLKRDAGNVLRFFKSLCTHFTDTDEQDRYAVADGDEEIALQKDFCGEEFQNHDRRLELEQWPVLSVEQTFEYITSPGILQPFLSKNATILRHSEGEKTELSTSDPWPVFDAEELAQCLDDLVASETHAQDKRAAHATQRTRLPSVNLGVDHLSDDVRQIFIEGRKKFGILCDATVSFLLEQAREPTTDDAVFVNTWIPSSLHQISTVADMDRDLDRQKRGEDFRALRFLALQQPQGVQTTPSTHSVDVVEGGAPPAAPPTVTSLVNSRNTTSKIAKKCSAVEAVSALIASKSIAPSEPGTDGMPDPDLVDGEDLKNEDEPEIGPHEVKFDGKIPEGVDPKVWKKTVKEQARLLREQKVPKKMKKRLHKKH